MRPCRGVKETLFHTLTSLIQTHTHQMSDTHLRTDWTWESHDLLPADGCVPGLSGWVMVPCPGAVSALERRASGPGDQPPEGSAGEGEPEGSPDHQLPAQHQRRSLLGPRGGLGTRGRIRLPEGVAPAWLCAQGSPACVLVVCVCSDGVFCADPLRPTWSSSPPMRT